MPTVSSTDGSPTSTCWKRRSSAASFSMCWRYSSSVVAPTRRSSPRASIGLIMLPGVHRALAGRAGADDRVQLVDERDDLARGVRDLLQDGLEPLLELAAVLRAGHHRAQVQRDHALAAQRLRHVAGHDALRQPLDDGGLADTGLTDQHGVVLGAPRQHLHDAADLGVPADHRVQLALAGTRRQVDAVLLQCLVAALGIRAGDPRRAAHLDERVAQRVRGRTLPAQQVGDGGPPGGEPDQHVLGRDVLVTHLGGELLGGGDRGERLARELGGRDRGAGGGGEPVAERRHLGANGGGIGADGREQGRRDAVTLREQRAQQVRGADVGVAGQRRGLHRGRDRLLGLRGGVETVHPRVLLRSPVGRVCPSTPTTPTKLSLFRSGSPVTGDTHPHRRRRRMIE